LFLRLHRGYIKVIIAAVIIALLGVEGRGIFPVDITYDQGKWTVVGYNDIVAAPDTSGMGSDCIRPGAIGYQMVQTLTIEW
jgi:hypothetical protein